MPHQRGCFLEFGAYCSKEKISESLLPKANVGTLLADAVYHGAQPICKFLLRIRPGSHSRMPAIGSAAE